MHQPGSSFRSEIAVKRLVGRGRAEGSSCWQGELSYKCLGNPPTGALKALASRFKGSLAFYPFPATKFKVFS